MGTKDYGILFGLNDTLGIVGYSDSEFAGCVDSRKSTTRYCFKLGNGEISWKSKLQECIATSTNDMCRGERGLHIVSSFSSILHFFKYFSKVLTLNINFFIYTRQFTRPIVWKQNCSYILLGQRNLSHNFRNLPCLGLLWSHTLIVHIKYPLCFCLWGNIYHTHGLV